MPDVTLDLGNQYIGSAYSPQVAITDTEDGHEIDFTFADSEHPGQLTTEGFEVPNYSSEEAAREAAEAARAAAESARAAAESSREEYEQQRKDNELDRVFNENARANAEELREDAEQARAAAETARASAETARASAEQSRAAAETARASAESGRATAESARVSAEQERAAAESARESAEQAREAAEQARETDTAAAIARADAATAAANTATSNADAATTAAQAATGEAETATDAANAAAALATAAAETITDAYFPGFTAGAAEGITGGGPTDTAAWTYRACPGTDGPATIESIHGRTVVWNQLANCTFSTRSTDGITLTNNGNGSLTIDGTSTLQSGTKSIDMCDINYVAGHKVLVKSGLAASASYVNVSGLGMDYGSGDIFTYETTAALHMRITFGVGTAFSNVTFYPQLFDLTAMFGAGNEPTTVAEFEALYPEPYYPYDAGSLLSVQMEGIESADADSNVIQTRTIPAATYFPDGMRSAGSVYDEMTETAAIVRVGAVDLGTLTWGLLDTNNGFQANLEGRIVQTSQSMMPYLQCAEYQTVSGYRANLPYDKTICEYNNANTRIAVRDDAYTDAAAFKASVSGVILYYALATPTTTTIEPPLNLSYRVSDFGTERIVHTDPTAPPTLVVTYGSTADGIRDRALACIAPVENGLASANYGVGSYLVHNGQLCRVTTAIATGEAITIGTNVVATTVMAEVIALTQ